MVRANLCLGFGSQEWTAEVNHNPIFNFLRKFLRLHQDNCISDSRKKNGQRFDEVSIRYLNLCTRTKLQYLMKAVLKINSRKQRSVDFSNIVAMRIFSIIEHILENLESY